MKKCPYRKKYVFKYDTDHLYENHTRNVVTVIEVFEECLKEDCMTFSKDGQSCRRG